MTDSQKLEKIAEENGLQTCWSVSEIENVYEEIGIQPNFINNGTHTDIKVELPNIKLTWLDLWKCSDELYTLIGNTDHRFIEEFKLNGDTIEVFFGS